MPPPRLVLASASPRRRALLAQVGLDPLVEPADLDEALVPGRDPAQQAAELALAKARAVAARHRGTATLVLGADTLVVVDGEPLGKPADADDARRTLARLAGRSHEVITAWAVLDAATGAVRRGVGRTTVHVRALDGDEIAAYVATGEPFDKAGGYGIQGVGALLVERIEGDHPTVVGLPVAAVALALRDLGLDALVLASAPDGATGARRPPGGDPCPTTPTPWSTARRCST